MGIGARGMLRWGMGNGTVGGGKGRERSRLARQASQSSGRDGSNSNSGRASGAARSKAGDWSRSSSAWGGPCAGETRGGRCGRSRWRRMRSMVEGSVTQGDDAHLTATDGAQEREHLVDPGQIRDLEVNGSGSRIGGEEGEGGHGPPCTRPSFLRSRRLRGRRWRSWPAWSSGARDPAPPGAFPPPTEGAGGPEGTAGSTGSRSASSADQLNHRYMAHTSSPNSFRIGSPFRRTQPRTNPSRCGKSGLRKSARS